MYSNNRGFMYSIIRTMLDDRKAYQHGNDYQILETDGVRQWRYQNPREYFAAPCTRIIARGYIDHARQHCCH